MDKLTAFPFLMGMTSYVKDRVSFGGIIQSLLVAGVSAGISIGVGMYVSQSVIRVELAGIKSDIDSMKLELKGIRNDFYRPVFQK